MRAGARHGGAVAVVFVVLALSLAALFSAYWVGDQVSPSQTDPSSREPGGAAAVANLLTRHGGVEVRSVRRSNELEQVETGGTLVVVPGPALTEQARARLAEAADRAGRVVLIRPEPEVLSALAPSVRPVASVDGVLRAQCDSSDADWADEISGPSRTYRAVGRGAAGAAQVCFTQVGGPAGAAGTGAVVTVTTGDRQVVVAGNATMLTNAALTDVDNAAIALRLLGHHRDLAWFVPIAEEAAAVTSQGTPWPPPWFAPLVLALGGTVAATMLWRGRRLGRLVTEPLPVVVQAYETTLARGQLYRRARDPGHAGGILVRASRTRLLAALKLPATSDVHHVARAAAGATGRHTTDVAALLTRTPATDVDLARLGADLRQLEREVRAHERTHEAGHP
ncbi:MAG: DUF4350 domain-containing protein [Dermatophilaceae bacterium]